LKIEGACYCGEITFQAEVDSDNVFNCHCTDCQTLSGSAYRTIAPSIEGTFEFISGTPKVFVKVAENGSRRAQAFCSECGTPIYSAPDDDSSSVIGIRVGAIKQRDQLPPKSQYWCRSAQSWVHDLKLLPKTETQ